MAQRVDAREAAVLGINTTLVFISLVVVGLVFGNRTYVPLKCKNIPLVYTLFVGMVFWYIGDIFAFQPTLVQRVSRPVCILTISWLRMSLGMYWVVSCHVFRIYQYYCIFQWKTRPVGKYLWRGVALWVVVPLVYGVLAMTLSETQGIYIGNPYTCLSAKPLYFVAVGLLLLLLAAWAYATWVMRRVNVCFNEYRELQATILCTILVVVLQVVLRWIPGIDEFAYNTVASLSDMLICLVALFTVVWRPLYHCLRGRDEYLRYFLEKLGREDRREEYGLANGAELDRLSASFGPRKDVVGGRLGSLEHEIESSAEWSRSVSSILSSNSLRALRPYRGTIKVLLDSKSMCGDIPQRQLI